MMTFLGIVLGGVVASLLTFFALVAAVVLICWYIVRKAIGL